MLYLPDHLLTGMSGVYLTLLCCLALCYLARALRENESHPGLRVMFDDRGWCWFASPCGEVTEAAEAWVIAPRSRVFAGGVLLLLTQPKRATRAVWVIRGECPESGLRRLSRVIIRLARQPLHA